MASVKSAKENAPSKPEQISNSSRSSDERHYTKQTCYAYHAYCHPRHEKLNAYLFYRLDGDYNKNCLKACMACRIPACLQKWVASLDRNKAPGAKDLTSDESDIAIRKFEGQLQSWIGNLKSRGVKTKADDIKMIESAIRRTATQLIGKKDKPFGKDLINYDDDNKKAGATSKGVSNNTNIDKLRKKVSSTNSVKAISKGNTGRAEIPQKSSAISSEAITKHDQNHESPAPASSRIAFDGCTASEGGHDIGHDLELPTLSQEIGDFTKAFTALQSEGPEAAAAVAELQSHIRKLFPSFTKVRALKRYAEDESDVIKLKKAQKLQLRASISAKR